MDTLRQYREGRGLTLAELASEIGVTESQLSRIERGAGTSLATAVKIEELTGIPAANLAKREEGEAA